MIFGWEGYPLTAGMEARDHAVPRSMVLNGRSLHRG
jgi:hypothetical protein